VGLSLIDHLLWFLSAALPILIIARIIYERIYVPPFDGFAFMLGVVVARDLVLACLHYGSHRYTIAWEFSLPVILVSQIYAALQNVVSITRIYPRFGKAAVRLFLGCFVVIALCCCLGLPFELHYITGESAVLRMFFLAQRWVDGCIAGTLLIACGILMRSPAPPRKPAANLVLHTCLLTIYFGGYSVLFFLENLAPLGAQQNVERAQFALVVFLYTLWATCLSAKRQRSRRWPEVTAILFRKATSYGLPQP